MLGCLKIILLIGSGIDGRELLTKHCQTEWRVQRNNLSDNTNKTMVYSAEEEKYDSLPSRDFGKLLLTQESLESFSAFCTTSSIPPTM